MLRIYEHTVYYHKGVCNNLPTIKCISRLQSWSLKPTFTFLNLCWIEKIWTLWSSFGSWWERVSQSSFFRLSPVYLFEHFKLKCHCRCDVLQRHHGLPKIGHWRVEIWWRQTLGMKRCLGIHFFLCRWPSQEHYLVPSASDSQRQQQFSQQTHHAVLQPADQ